jgi:hypothetical protein
MKILTILFLFFATTAAAENWICYDETTKQVTRKVQGDCLKLGLCSGFNNTGLQDNCFEASLIEWEDSKAGNKKFDGSIISGSRVVPMTQEEIDLKEKPAKDAQKEQKDKLDALKLKLKGLGLTDEEVDIILNSGN